MIISVKIGYNSPIIFRNKSDAWAFMSDVFNAAFTADNPEDMPIEASFEMEGVKDEAVRSDSGSKEV